MKDALVYLAAVVLAFVLLVTGHPWWIVAVALVAAVLLRPEAGR